MGLVIAPLERVHAEALTRLPSTFATALGVHGVDGWTDWLTSASGTSVHRLGAWHGDALVGVAEVVPATAARRRHVATLRVAAIDAATYAAVVAAAIELADRWLGVGRLEAACAVDDDDALAVLVGVGFEREAVRVGHIARAHGVVDGIALGRLRPGWVPPPPPPMTAGTGTGPPTTALPVLRLATVDDAAAVAAIMRDPLVCAGTLQVPSTSADAWTARLAASTNVWVITVDDRVVGNGGLHLLAAPSAHVAGFGMAIAGRCQGLGLGRRMLFHLICAAHERGLQRLTLDVFAHNGRAQALYRAAGFVVEGRRRAEATCDGGYADSLVMSRPLVDG